MRLILSAYAGPMPRPVVPILFRPEETLGDLVDRLVVGRDDVRVGDTTSSPAPRREPERVELGNSAPDEMTTPLAMTEVQPGVRMPARQEVGGELSPLTTIVWPALCPPGADAVVDRVVRGEQIGRLALALVAPLGAQDHDRGHRSPPPRRRRHVTKRANSHPRWPSARVHPVDPIFVIANGAAGTSDEENSNSPGRPAPAGSVEVGHHRFPRRARRRPAPGGLTHHRGGRRRRHVHAVVAALHRRHDLDRTTLGTAPDGHRQRLRTQHGHPARRRGGRADRGQRRPRPVDMLIDELGGVVVNSVHAGAGRDGRKEAAAGSTGSAPSGSAGSTWAGSATRSVRCAPPSRRRRCGCTSSSTARWSTTWTSRC